MNLIETLIIGWANERGLIEGTTAEKQALKLVEEVGELCKAIIQQDQEAVVDGIGDCFVVLVNLSNKMGLSLEHCAWEVYEEIRDRKGDMVNGTFVKRGV